MSEHTYEVVVPKDLEDLIPGFLANRRKEVGLLASALIACDFVVIGLAARVAQYRDFLSKLSVTFE